MQKSEDGFHFKEVGTIAGHGTTNEAHTYTFDDIFPVIGKNYYRLESIDFDGTTQIFNWIEVNYSASKSFSVYPNPSKGSTLYMSSNTPEQNSKVAIFNTTGNFVAEVQIQSGSQQVVMPQPLPNGIYYAKLSGTQFSQTVRFVVIQ